VTATRIVHVATRFLASGTERAIADIVAALPAPGFEHVLIVGRDHDPVSIRTLCGDIQVIVSPRLVRRPDPLQDPLTTAHLTRTIRRLRPTILHTIQSKSGILGRVAGRLAGVQAFVHTVNMANFGAGFHPLLSVVYANAERLVGTWTDRFPVNGTELRDRYLRAGIGSQEQYVMIRSSVDPGPFRAAANEGMGVARARLGLRVDPPTILFAGSLDERKGALDLPQFLVAVRKRVPDATLVVAGDGPLRAELERRVQERGLASAVRFLGFTAQVPEAMTAADCLVMLSRAEGLATVLVQAGAAGTPFVSYDVDGPAELIDLGAVGCVVPRGDLEAAAAATGAMLCAVPSGRLALDEWAPDEVRRRYRAVFEDVAAVSRRR
jgi:glycosyltransferase involved in cell wall biosynthesis